MACSIGCEYIRLTFVQTRHALSLQMLHMELVVIGELRPALKTEFFLETMYSLDAQGKTNKNGLPNPLQFAAILNEYYGELFVVGQPIPAQKFVAKIVGGLAKRIGYKGYIPFSCHVADRRT